MQGASLSKPSLYKSHINQTLTVNNGCGSLLIKVV